MFRSRTKIIVTLGPATDPPHVLETLIQQGVAIVRCNLSHGSHAEHAARIEQCCQLRQKLQIPFSILIDLKGPELRLGAQDPITFTDGQELLFGSQNIQPFTMLQGAKKGMAVLFDDGRIEGTILDVQQQTLRVAMHGTGVLHPRKSINIPAISQQLPLLTEEDVRDLAWARTQPIDMLAISFTQSAQHLQEVRRIFGQPITLVAKIEQSGGIENLDAIILESDAVMIARGDLGVEFPMEDVPHLQETIVERCRWHATPAIIATHMLESMIEAPRPTRAEVSDVAQAVAQDSSLVMLSGETAMGRHPTTCVDVLQRVLHKCEAIEPTDGSLLDAACCAAQQWEPDVIIIEGADQSIITAWSARHIPARTLVITQEKNFVRWLYWQWGIEPYADTAWRWETLQQGEEGRLGRGLHIDFRTKTFYFYQQQDPNARTTETNT